jgi:hypothetical protein
MCTASVHQIRFHHRYHNLILSNQLVIFNGMRVRVQSGTAVSVPQHSLDGLDVSLCLRD